MLSSCPAWIGASSLAGCEGRGDEYEEGGRGRGALEGELFGVVGQWLLLLLLLLSRAAGGEGVWWRGDLEGRRGGLGPYCGGKGVVGAACSRLLLRAAGDGAHRRGDYCFGGPEGKWEGETMVVARDEPRKVLRVRPIHTSHFNHRCSELELEQAAREV